MLNRTGLESVLSPCLDRIRSYLKGIEEELGKTAEVTYTDVSSIQSALHNMSEQAHKAANVMDAIRQTIRH